MAKPAAVPIKPIVRSTARSWLRFNHCLRSRSYSVCRRVIPRCKPALKRWIGFGSPPLHVPRTLAVAIGVNDSALTVENKMAPPMAKAIGWYSRPMDPGMRSTGIKTAARTSDVATTAPASSAMAFSAACCGASPRSMRLAMSSVTTIASSTTMPVARTRPNRIKLFSSDPLSRTTTRLPTKATGTAIPGIMARRQRPRNNTRTSNTRITASRKVPSVRSRLS